MSQPLIDFNKSRIIDGPLMTISESFDSQIVDEQTATKRIYPIIKGGMRGGFELK